eukprot:COSAG02_NODE_1831_length_10724_cov_44.091859_6_plen_115_part_00
MASPALRLSGCDGARSPRQPVGAVGGRSVAAGRFWASGCIQFARRWGLGGGAGVTRSSRSRLSPSARRIVYVSQAEAAAHWRVTAGRSDTNVDRHERSGPRSKCKQLGQDDREV